MINRIPSFYIIFLILIISTILICIIKCRTSIEKFMLYERSSLYEKVIVSTIKDKKKIPSYINENRQQYAPNYNHIFFDDNDCISFLEKHYKQKYTDAFKNMKSGAHKADLFRYAYLYKMGGLYVDVKTLFYKNVNLIIKMT